MSNACNSAGTGLKPTFRRSLNRIDGYKFKKFTHEVIAQ